MIVASNLPEFQKEKVDALFYRMIRRRLLLRKWLGGRMPVTDVFSKLKEEKVATLFYKIVYKIVMKRLLLRKWLRNMLISRELTPRINRTSSRSKGSGNPSELRD